MSGSGVYKTNNIKIINRDTDLIYKVNLYESGWEDGLTITSGLNDYFGIVDNKIKGLESEVYEDDNIMFELLSICSEDSYVEYISDIHDYRVTYYKDNNKIYKKSEYYDNDCDENCYKTHRIKELTEGISLNDCYFRFKLDKSKFSSEQLEEIREANSYKEVLVVKKFFSKKENITVHEHYEEDDDFITLLDADYREIIKDFSDNLDCIICVYNNGFDSTKEFKQYVKYLNK